MLQKFTQIKKIALLLMAIAMVTPAFAGGDYVVKKNHISLCYVDYTACIIAAGFGDAISGDKSSYVGAFTAQYTRSIKNWLEVGGVVAVGGTTKSLMGHIMPVANFNYWRNSWFKISGEAGVGVAFTRDSAGFAFQVYPAVMRFGSDKIAGVIKGGIGTMGYVGIGLQFGF